MTIRIGVIGCGAIGQLHLQAISRHPAARVVACADVNPQNARRVANQFAIPHVLTDAAALLARDDLDLVFICVPPKWHAELFLAALGCGKHVLAEKPLAIGLAQADRMVDAAAESDRIVGVALTHRYQTAYHAVRDLIQAGAIGQLRLVRLSFGHSMCSDSRFITPEQDPRSWLVDRNIAGGGILMSSSIHFLSVVSFVLGGPVFRRVTARLRQLLPRPFPGIEDEVDLWMELDGGLDFVLRESWASDVPFRAELLGNRGRLVLAGENWTNLSIDGACDGPVPATYRSRLAGNQFHAVPAQVASPTEPLFMGLVEDLIESIHRRKHVPRMPDVVHARNMQAVIAAAYQSQETGKSVEIQWR